MSRGLEITLRGSFVAITRAYVEAFPRAYRAFGASSDDFEESLASYASVIEENCEAIYRVAAAEISTYLNLYNIHANKSADEFKIIYYVGVAIERHLQRVGLAYVGQVHSFAMVGLLDFRLQTLNYKKPQLTKALTRLIKLGKLESELGATGCYMIYKCVSTAQPIEIPKVSAA